MTQPSQSNAAVLSRIGLPSMYTLHRQRRLRWLGQRHPLWRAGVGEGNNRPPSPTIYPVIDVCVRDMKAVDIDTMPWEGLAADRTKWKSAVKQQIKTGEDKRARGMQGSSSIRPETTHRCVIFDKDCHFHIGIFSHKRRCYNPARNVDP